MSFSIDLTNLVKEQYKLDTTIQTNHHITYQETYLERVLSLLVELGEFANTTRCFKFWSNKGMEEKERVLDEAADCLHFYLSLYITSFININNESAIDTISLKGIMVDTKVLNKKELTSLFHNAFRCASNDFKYDSRYFICNDFNEDSDSSFVYFLKIIAGLGFNFQDLEEAYYKKLGVNYVRQQTNY